MAGHFVVLAAFLVQADPSAASLRVNIGNAHLENGADAGEGVDHERDQGAIAQADPGAGVDRIEESARFLGGQHGRFAFSDGVLRAAHSACRVCGDDLSDDKPVEQHANGGQVELDRGGRDPLLKRLDIGGDVHLTISRRIAVTPVESST